MFGKLAVRLLGDILRPHMDDFEELKLNLRKARMSISTLEYACIMFLIGLITFVAAVVVIPLVMVMAGIDAGFAYTFGVMISFMICTGVILLGYFFPHIRMGEFRKKIDVSLPFVSFCMTASASAGINPVEMFKVISKRKGILGEEARKIYSNVKTLGCALPDVLQKSAVNSPSPDFADLLWGMMTVMTSGGNMENFLRVKTETLMNKYRRLLDEYAKTITLYTELYITLIIVGNLFFIILTAIMTPLAGGMGGGFSDPLVLQTFLVFLLIPLVSVGFIVLLKGAYPAES
jgi:flagellar protein FlaJ